MDNSYLLKLPMKSINNFVKLKLMEHDPYIKLESVGISFKNNFKGCY